MPFRFPVAPELREFLYHVIYSLPENKKFDLKGWYYQLGRTQFMAKRFCDTASYEQIHHILAMLGIQWYTTYFDNSKSPKVVRNVFSEFKESSRNTEIKRLIKERIYISSDKKFIHSLGLASDGLSSNVYKQNLELDKAGSHARKWSKQLNFKNITNARRDEESIDYLWMTARNAAFSFRQSKMTEDDILILSYLYLHRNRYVPFDEIETKHLGYLRQLKLKRSINRLMHQDLIILHIKKNEKKYQISALGIERSNKILDSILKANAFQRD